MRSRGNGSLLATMRKREGGQPRNTPYPKRTKAYISWKSELVYALNGEYILAWRGRSPWRVDENVCIGTWENQSISRKL